MHKLLVVLTRGRTGSTPLVADIDQHPQVVCHQELFRTATHSPHDRVPSFYTAGGLRPGLTAQQYVDDLARQADRTVFGFKLLISNLDEWPAEVGLREFLLNRAHVVFLSRDPMAAAISAGIAKARDAYNIQDGDVDDEYRERLSRKVVVDAQYVSDEARYFAYWAEHWLSVLSEANVPHVHITYEAYCADRLSTLNSVFHFLGLPALTQLAPNPYSRVTSSVVWDDIVNADEVRGALGL